MLNITKPYLKVHVTNIIDAPRLNEIVYSSVVCMEADSHVLEETILSHKNNPNVNQ